MMSRAASRPVFAISALGSSAVALACPLVAYFLPTGSGEEGMARAFTHLAVAMASVDVLMVTWAALAASSRRRDERGGWHLLVGFLALVAAMGLCLAPVYSVGPANALIAALVMFGPAILVSGAVGWFGRPRNDLHGEPMD